MNYDTLENQARYSCIPHAWEIAGFPAAQRYCHARGRLPPHRSRRRGLQEESVLPQGDNEHPVRIAPGVCGPSSCHQRRGIVKTVFLPDAVPAVAYAEKDDVEFFTARGNVSDVVLSPGMFLWLFPNEPHRPGCVCPGFGGEVVKGVVKVRMR